MLIIGAGGHAKVVAELLRVGGRPTLGYLDADPTLHGSSVLGHEVLGGDEQLKNHPSSDVELANGVGGVQSTAARRSVFVRYSGRGYRFATLVHASAVVGAECVIESASQIMAGVVLQPGVMVGTNTIINTRASVDHDCLIGSNVHIAPGVVLSGNVVVGDGAHIGTGASIIQGVTIGCDALIAAGAVVVADVPEGARVAGVPARPLGVSS